jgi:hypothetical protein
VQPIFQSERHQFGQAHPDCRALPFRLPLPTNRFHFIWTKSITAQSLPHTIQYTAIVPILSFHGIQQTPWIQEYLIFNSPEFRHQRNRVPDQYFARLIVNNASDI